MAATEPLDILIKGIVAKWAASASIVTAVPFRGRQQRTSATSANPASAGHFPYAVIFGEPETNKFTQTCAKQFWRHRIRIRIYDVSFSAVAPHADKVTAIFSSQTLTLTLSVGDLLRNEHITTRDIQESEGVCCKELLYEFETYLPLVS